MEVVVRDVVMEGNPILIPGYFLFQRQTSETFENCIEMLLKACPVMKHCGFVTSDGCKFLGAVLREKFSLAFHGVLNIFCNISFSLL